MTKPTGRRRGRPQGLPHDDWRYLYAATEAMIENARLSGHLSELQICENMAGHMIGRPLRPGEFILEDGVASVGGKGLEAMRAGQAFPVVHRRWDEAKPHVRADLRAKEPHPPKDGQWPWRFGNEFRPTADNIRKKLRRLRKEPVTSVNGRWFTAMVKAIRICAQGSDHLADFAARQAAAVGEGQYFERTLHPILRSTAALHQRWPEKDEELAAFYGWSVRRDRRPLERPRFPRPLRYNGRKFYRRSELDHFKTELEAAALGRPLPPKPPPPTGDPLVAHKAIALEFGVTPRSVDRWVVEAVESDGDADAA